MSNKVIKFEYKDSKVSFVHEDGSIMINATEMAKPFGKKVNDWTRLQSSKDFLGEYSKESGYPITIENANCETGIPASHLIVVNKGNTSKYSQGTWMHKDIALEFARWLSPMFAIWCNKKIMELLEKGETKLDIPSYQIQDDIERAKAWIKEREELRAKQLEIQKLESEVKDKTEEVSNLVDDCTYLKLESHAFKHGIPIKTKSCHVTYDSITLVDLADHPNYTTSEIMYRTHPNYLFRFEIYTVLAEYFNWRLYKIPNYNNKRDKTKVIYPKVLYRLNVEFQDKYWGEISKDGKHYDITGAALGYFIIEKVIEEDRKSEFYNKSGKDELNKMI